MRSKGQGEEVQEVSTEDSVVKCDCEEKEGNGAVSGMRMLIWEFPLVGFSGSQRAHLLLEK